MGTREIGIIMNGVTGRMGKNQHLIRSIVAIIEQGGIKVSDDLTLLPRPVLTGRNEQRLAAVSRLASTETTGPLPYTTDIDSVLADPQYHIFFDASGTLQRAGFIERAVAAGKAIYCEKPTATTTAEALRLAQVCERAGVKNGVVQDKLWLPGLRKFQMLKDQGFFGKILSVRGEFGYWVFEGDTYDQPTQRPSWNYRAEDGGGMVIDMHCHWRYVIDNLFGDIASVNCHTATHVQQRVDESGKAYPCTADDSAYAIFLLNNGIVCQFNSSWCVRVRRDDLLTLQVDGSKGSAVVGLRKCWIQPAGATPKPVWNPDIDQPIDFYDGWQEVPDNVAYDNAFKIQWEQFIRHVALDEAWRYSLREGAKGVQLAELSLRSAEERRFIDVPELEV